EEEEEEEEEVPLVAKDFDGWAVETRLVEVKGPSDRLSERQVAWLRILGEAGSVCHVVEGSAGRHCTGNLTS
ncbi:unnamed protein product, partial [Choristocarpus tenellus]